MCRIPMDFTVIYKIPILEKPNRCPLFQLFQQCTEVCFASFLSGGLTTVIVVNPPERKLAKRTSVQWFSDHSGILE